MSASSIQKPCFVGIDVGGTNIKLGLVDDIGRTLAYHTMRTQQDKGAEGVGGEGHQPSSPAKRRLICR